MRALLARQGLSEALEKPSVDMDTNKKTLAEIQLCIERSPLIQVCNIQSTFETWETLKSLYSPQGFSMDLFVAKELFRCKLRNYNSMEEYVNAMKQNLAELETRELLPPKILLIAFIIDGLTDKYDMVSSNITQSLRNDVKSYGFESLFSTF